MKILGELIRIRQLLQTMSQVQERCLQAELEQCRLLRRIAPTTGEMPAVRVTQQPFAPYIPRDHGDL